jgi:Cu(I)/Ag(I) efflux system membrane protein CusA/SilA
MARSHTPIRRLVAPVESLKFEVRAKQRLKFIVPIVFFVIFLLLYMVFHSIMEAAGLIFPTFYAMTGGQILQYLLGYNFSVAVWVGYIALFGIAVETGVVMVVVQRLRPKLMTVTAVVASLIPMLWESGIGSDVMNPSQHPWSAA